MARGTRNIQVGTNNGDGNKAQQWHKEQETPKVAMAMVMAMRLNNGTRSNKHPRRHYVAMVMAMELNSGTRSKKRPRWQEQW